MKTEQISAGQWVGLLLVSRLSTAATFSSVSSDGYDLWSVVLYGLTLAALLLPSVLQARRRGQADILRQGHRVHPVLGRVLAVLLGLYCLYVLAVSALQFMYFVRESLSPDMSAAALCVALMTAAFWAAFYGLEAIARAVLPIAVLLCGSIVAVLIFLIPDMQTGYLMDALLTAATPGGWLTETVRTTEAAIAGLLLSHVSTPKIGRSIVGIAAGATAFILLIRITVTATLGDFAKQRFYPYHTVMTAVENGIFRRIDLVIVSIWIAAIFVKMTLFAWAFSRCVKPLIGEKRSRWIVPLGGLIAVVCGIMGSGQPHDGVSRWLIGISGGGILLFAVVCPLLLMLLRMKGEKAS